MTEQHGPAPMTDEQIEQAVKTEGVTWTGYREDEHGFYTIPVLSPYHYQLARAIEAAVNAQWREWLGKQEPVACWCTTCRPITLEDMRFVTCPDCGNKRCPKAHNHTLTCTNSNEPGQRGSSWENVKPHPAPKQDHRLVIQQALEALQEIHPGNMTPMAETNWNAAITSLKKALDE